jgi:hypothetical protein
MDARAITIALGGRWCGRYGLAPCPAHDDRDPSLKVKDDQRKSDGIDLHCFAGCEWLDVKSALRQQGLIAANGERRAPPLPKPVPNADDDTKRRTEYALSLWRSSSPLPGTLGERYFIEHRKLNVRTLDLHHCLRWSETARTVIALMRHPMTDTPCGIHRTFLNEDGTKRERKMLGRQGVVRLTPDEDVTLGIGITEGVEDGPCGSFIRLGADMGCNECERSSQVSNFSRHRKPDRFCRCRFSWP